MKKAYQLHKISVFYSWFIRLQ